jgi:hypothetical protein
MVNLHLKRCSPFAPSVASHTYLLPPILLLTMGRLNTFTVPSMRKHTLCSLPVKRPHQCGMNFALLPLLNESITLCFS